MNVLDADFAQFAGYACEQKGRLRDTAGRTRKYRQQNLTDIEYGNRKRKTKREEFLEAMTQ